MKTIQLRCTFMSQPVDASGAGASLGMERQIVYHFLLHDQSRLLSDELCPSHQEVGHRAHSSYCGGAIPEEGGAEMIRIHAELPEVIEHLELHKEYVY